MAPPVVAISHDIRAGVLYDAEATDRGGDHAEGCGSDTRYFRVYAYRMPIMVFEAIDDYARFL